MKFGRIKRQHGRVGGLDKILDRIVRDCPDVSRIVPGRIKVRRGKSPPSFKVQYPTGTGLKSVLPAPAPRRRCFLSARTRVRHTAGSSKRASPRRGKIVSDSGAIVAAVKILRGGGLVAFATETVYGLGRCDQSPSGQRIYEAKGRPPTNPLIVHVSDEAMAKRYAARLAGRGQGVGRRILAGAPDAGRSPGAAIAPQVSAGLDTIGIRSPNHALAQSLLRQFDGPIAAPSATGATGSVRPPQIMSARRWVMRSI